MPHGHPRPPCHLETLHRVAYEWDIQRAKRDAIDIDIGSRRQEIGYQPLRAERALLQPAASICGRLAIQCVPKIQ